MKNWIGFHSKHISEVFGCRDPKKSGIFKILLVFSIIFLLGACTSKKQEDIVVTDETVFLNSVENLDIPWSITKIGKKFYISERKGTIAMIEGQTDELMRLPVHLNESLHTEGEGGLLGLELIPNTNLEAYIYHTYMNDGQVMNRVVRIEKRMDG